MRKCTTCRKKTTASVERYDYSELSGLPIALEGVTVYRCECGNSAVKIPAVEQLHRLIATDLARGTGHVNGAEIRFMRTWLGLSSQDFAATMGVTPEQASRWQNDRKPMGASAEKLLRLMVRTAKPSCDYSEPSHVPAIGTEEIQAMGDGKRRGRSTVAITHDRGGWRMPKAA